VQVVIAPDSSLPRFGDYVYVEELPEAITRVPPSYPDEARKHGIQGTVMGQCLVLRDGTVGDVRIVKSIPGLDEAAMACLRQWRFKPALAKGQPVVVWVGVPVKFSLH
jgi:protein TonB